MPDFNLSAAQHNLIERLYNEKTSLTKSDFDDPQVAKELIKSLVEKRLVFWDSIGYWKIRLSEEGKAYYKSYVESQEKEKSERYRDQEMIHQSKRQNTLSLLALIVSALSLLTSIILPLLLHYL